MKSIWNNPAFLLAILCGIWACLLEITGNPPNDQVWLFAGLAIASVITS